MTFVMYPAGAHFAKHEEKKTFSLCLFAMDITQLTPWEKLSYKCREILLSYLSFWYKKYQWREKMITFFQKKENN